MTGRPFYGDYADYLSTPLFRVIRQVAIERAAGRCELCGIAPPVEVHHRVYPFWGAFDVPSNLIAVCHHCHCREHNKPKRGTNGGQLL